MIQGRYSCTVGADKRCTIPLPWRVAFGRHVVVTVNLWDAGLWLWPVAAWRAELATSELPTFEPGMMMVRRLLVSETIVPVDGRGRIALRMAHCVGLSGIAVLRGENSKASLVNDALRQ